MTRSSQQGRIASPLRAKLFDSSPLSEGDVCEGLVRLLDCFPSPWFGSLQIARLLSQIYKITDYGAFVKVGHEQTIGLMHIATLAGDERVPKDTIPDWVEENVGPVGSKVRCEVLQLEFRGAKRISLRLLDVVTRQRMDE